MMRSTSRCGVVLSATLALAALVAGCSSAVPATSAASGADAGAEPGASSGKPVLTLKGGAR